MKLNHFLIILFIILSFDGFSQDSKEQKELIKASKELFDDGEYAKALPLYSQLLSIYPSEALYSFYYGACLVENNKEIDKAIKYLSYGAKKLTDQPLVYYYLGSAYHLSYQFDKAIAQYQIFQTKSALKQQREKQIEREINICNNGLDLVKYASQLIVLDNKKIKQSNFQYSYNLSEIGGKLVVKPDQFKTKVDLKRDEKELIFISDNGLVLFSSLGDNKKGDRNIYWSKKDSTEEFTPSINIGDIINTPFDEDYPFLKSDGKTLYFCSKGHNTMGGFDIFRSTYDSVAQSWTTPVNLDFPTNTPYDDLLYVVDANDNLAYFASNRESEENKLNVYKIQVDKNPIERAVNNLEEIQQMAKLDVTPLADLPKNEEKEENKEKAIATTEVSNYTSQGPKKHFSFDDVYEKNVSSPSDYTGLLRKDLKQLQEDLSSTEAKNILASNIAHNKLGELREIQSKIETRRNGLPSDEQYENKELNELIEKSVKINTQALIAAKISENLSDEIQIRKREAKITEMLLNDSANNNTQELVQNINANRKFLQQNNKTYLSIQNWAREKEREKTLVDEALAQKKKDVQQKNIEFNKALSDYKLAEKESKKAKEPSKVEEANSTLNLLKQDLSLAKSEVIYAEQEQQEKISQSKRLAEEIIFLKTINSEISDKQNQQLAGDLQALDNKVIVKNANDLNNAVVAIQGDKILNTIQSKYEAKTKDIFLSEEDLLAENTDEQQVNNVESESNTDEKTVDENSKPAEESEVKENDAEENNIIKSSSENSTPSTEANKPEVSKEDIAQTNLAQVHSLEARKKYNEAKINAQISDSLYSLASEKETRVNFIPSAEKQDIVRNEIEELKQLAAIKATQSQTNYQDAKKAEETYIVTNQTDSALEAIIQQKLFADETEGNNNPEFIEYKKAAYKEQHLKQSLNEVTAEKTNIESALNDDKISPETRSQYQKNLSAKISEENKINDKINKAKDTQLAMLETLTSSDQSLFTISEATSSLSNVKQLSEQVSLSKQQSKANNAIQKDKETTKELFSAWETKKDEINQLEDSLLVSEDITTKSKLLDEIDKTKEKAWSGYTKANSIHEKANKEEVEVLTDLLNTSRKHQKNEKVSQAYVYEKESELFLKKAATIREKTKPSDIYNTSNAEALKKAQFYEDIAINKQKAALEIYASIPAEEPTENVLIADNSTEKSPNNENFKDEDVKVDEVIAKLIPNEQEKVKEYEKLYSQAGSKQKKVDNYWKDVEDSKYKLERTFAKKDQEKLKTKIKNQELKAKLAQHEAYLIQQKANTKKYDLTNQKTSHALNISSSKEDKAIAQQYLLDAEFYYEESQKVVVDSLLNHKELKAQQSKKISLENEAIKSQELAYATLAGKSEADFLTSSSLVKVDTTEVSEKPVDKSIIQKVQSQRILNRLELTSYEVKQLSKVEKLKDEHEKLKEEYLENKTIIEELTDSLPKVTDPKQWKKMDAEISDLEAKSLAYLFNIAQTTEPINYERYMVYKNHVKGFRIKGRGEKAVAGRTLEKEANKAFRKAQNLRTRSFEVVSVDRAFEMLTKAQELEVDALINMEKAYEVYMDLPLIDEDVEQYLAERTDTNKAGIHGYTVIESEGQVEEFEAPEVDLTVTPVLSNDTSLTAYQPSDSIEIPVDTIPTVETEVDTIYIADNKVIEYIEEPKDTISTENLIVENNTTEETVSNDSIPEENTIANNLTDKQDFESSEKDSLPEHTPIEETIVNKTAEKDSLSNETTIEETLAESTITKAPTDTATNASSETENVAEVVNNENIENKSPEVTNENDTKEKETSNSLPEESGKSTIPVFRLSEVSIYSRRNPIPIDKALPAGIVYKIQIGAFTKPIPQNSFRGLTPITGETRQNSKYVRYFVGLFNTYDAANTALPFIKNSGYQDAFIVAYKDGQRVAIYLAKQENNKLENYQELASKETQAVLKTVNSNADKIAGNTSTEKVNPSVNLTELDGAMYTVQIGVYKNHVAHARLKNLAPLYNDFTKSGLIRYTVGRFVDYTEANKRKNEIRQAGIKDAFITAYKDGQKISISQARKELAKVESENKTIPTETETNPTTSINKPDYNTEKLFYRVQIGAYSNSVPVSVVSSFLKLSKLDQLDNFVSSNGKTVYTIGRFKSLSQANLLKKDLIESGITDAFIIAFDGKVKVPIDEAQKVLEP